MTNTLRALALLFLVPAFVMPAVDLAAAEPADHVPADALLYWGWSGSNALEEPFAKTAMGRFCNDPAVAKLWDTAWKMIRGQLPPPLADGLDKLQTGCQHAGSLSFLGVAVGDAGMVPQIALQFECGDDAAKIHQAIEELREMFGIEAGAPLTAGDATLSRMQPPGMPFPVVYGKLGSGYVICTGVATAQHLVEQREPGAVGLSANPRFAAGRKHLSDKPLLGHLFVDVRGMIAKLKQLEAEHGLPIPPVVTTIVDSEEVKSIGGVTWGLALDGQGFRRVVHAGVDGMAQYPAATDADLMIAPKNVEFFSLTRSNLATWYGIARGLLRSIVPFIDDIVEGAVTSFEEDSGVTVEGDLLAGLGTQFLMFTEKGRTGLFSSSFSVVLKPQDPKKLERVFRKLASYVGNFFAGEDSSVRVSIHAIESDGSSVNQITVQGAPVGIAPAWAIHEGRMLLGMSSLDVLETLERIKSGGRAASILANDDFQKIRAGMPAGAYGLTYVDMKETLKAGYPWLVYTVQAGLSYFGQHDPSLAASLVPPPYKVTQWGFGDLTAEYVDASGYLALSHGPAPIALPASTMQYLPLIAAGAAGVWFFVANEREERIVDGLARTTLLSMEIACDMYKVDHGEYPAELSKLEGGGYLDDPHILSEFDSAYRKRGEQEELLIFQRKANDQGMVLYSVMGGTQKSESIHISQLHEMLIKWQEGEE